MASTATLTARTPRPPCAEEPRRSVRVSGAGCPTACVRTYSPAGPRNPLKGSGHPQLRGCAPGPAYRETGQTAQQNF